MPKGSQTRTGWAVGVVLLLLLVLLAGPAAAQGIDGSWCRNDQRLTITGRSILTPGGGQAQGENGGDSFSYVVPPGDPGAGGFTSLQQLSETEAQLRSGEHAPPQTWKRCTPPTS